MEIMNANAYDAAKDSQKVVVQSPYKLYPGEDLVRIPAEKWGYVDAAPEDIEILRIINRYLFMTSKLLTIAMNNAGWNIDDLAVKKRLKYMADKGVISRYRFVTDTGRSSYLVYKLDVKGRAIIARAASENGRMITYTDKITDSKNVEAVKRILAVNQCLITCFTGAEAADGGSGCETITGSMVTDAPADKKAHRIFRATGLAHRPGESIIIEAVRRGSNSADEFAKKLKRINDTLAHKTFTGIDKDRVTVYVIAEDKEHMEEIAELVRDIPRDSYNLAATYDTGIFDGSNDITKLPGCKRRNILDRIRESLGMVTGRKTA